VNDLAVTHNQLGMIYKNAGDIDLALPHYRESIRLYEGSTNLYAAGQTRFNVALGLAQSPADGRSRVRPRRPAELPILGDRAADKVAKTQQLLAHIEQSSPRRRGADSAAPANARVSPPVLRPWADAGGPAGRRRSP